MVNDDNWITEQFAKARVENPSVSHSAQTIVERHLKEVLDGRVLTSSEIKNIAKRIVADVISAPSTNHPAK